MDILIVANKPPYPPKDGSSIATLNLAVGLAQSGNNVKILAFSTQKHPCNTERIPVELRNLIEFQIVRINTSINLFNATLNLLFSRLPYNIERFIDKSFSQKLSGIITTNRFDLIQIEGLYLFPYIKVIKRLTSTPIVYRSHNIEHEIWQRISNNEKRWVKAQYLKLLSRRIRKIELKLTKHVSALVSISKRDEQWFKDNGFKRPSISIPSGFTKPESNDITSLANNDLCYLGSLDWIPNQEGLIWFLDQVWPTVLKEYPSIKFHVAGRNTPSSIAERLKKEASVIFHGEVDSAQNYLKNYSIVVVPILSGSGMRVKIVEGMMLGKAIITSAIGLEGIEAANGEQVIIADKPNDFAKAIIEIIRRPNLKASIAEKARIFAMENFDNLALTKKLETFYKQLI